MKITNKLKNNNGAAMILAIILMLLVSIVIVMFSSQLSNGFKVTSRNYEDLKIKYILEAGIENAIGTTLTNIEYEYLYGNKYLQWKKNKDIVFEEPSGTKVVGSTEYPLRLQIKNDDIENTNIENEPKYTLQEINIDMLKSDKYMIIIQNRKKPNTIIYKYYIRSADSDTYIIANTKYNGRNYSMKSKIKFNIEDLKTGKVKYTVESWGDKN